MANQKYRDTSLGRTLQAALEELREGDDVSPSLVNNVLHQFDRSMDFAMEHRVHGQMAFDADSLKSYRFVDGKWTFHLDNVTFRERHHLTSVDKVRVVAADPTQGECAEDEEIVFVVENHEVNVGEVVGHSSSAAVVKVNNGGLSTGTDGHLAVDPHTKYERNDGVVIEDLGSEDETKEHADDPIVIVGLEPEEKTEDDDQVVFIESKRTQAEFDRETQMELESDSDDDCGDSDGNVDSGSDNSEADSSGNADGGSQSESEEDRGAMDDDFYDSDEDEDDDGSPFAQLELYPSAPDVDDIDVMDFK